MLRLVLISAALVSGCATTYRAPAPALSAFEFTLSPEQCATLKAERRKYRATEQAVSYVSGAGSLLTTIFLAIPDLRDERAVQGASAGVALAAGAVGVFTGSQVNSLDEEIAAGCR